MEITMELNRIKGKIAFISGPSNGKGKAVAEKLNLNIEKYEKNSFFIQF